MNKYVSVLIIFIILAISNSSVYSSTSSKHKTKYTKSSFLFNIRKAGKECGGIFYCKKCYEEIWVDANKSGIESAKQSTISVEEMRKHKRKLFLEKREAEEMKRLQLIEVSDKIIAKNSGTTLMTVIFSLIFLCLLAILFITAINNKER